MYYPTHEIAYEARLDENAHVTHLDEYALTYDLDDEYARDTHDYVELAYKHYA